jgi:uncharacterized membrane protein
MRAGRCGSEKLSVVSKHSHEVTVAVQAPAEVVWAVLSDVETMPSWTESMTSVTRLDDVPMRIGSKVRIKQPRLPPTVWTVTEYVEGRQFSWDAKAPGATTRASHVVTPDGPNSTLTLRIDVTGPLAGALWRMSAGLTRRYLQMEAEGLARAAQARAAG